MREEILINVTPQETRVALAENGMLQEVHLERASSRGIVGNIYKGIVRRVMPGMQAAFVDIGQEKAAFLHVADVYSNSGLILADDAEKRTEQAAEADITRLLREGQKIVVQVIKDPISTKGARITTHISIPSRYLVYMPKSKHLGISQKITQDEERERLKSAFTGDDAVGFIIRTAAEGCKLEDLEKDTRFLKNLWSGIESGSKSVKSPGLIHEDLRLEMRILRDLNESNVERIRIDNQQVFEKAHKFTTKFIPELKGRIENYQGERPIFELYIIEEEIKKALERKVSLKSGGYLVIDQTEAMTTVDVNTGAFVGHKNLEETIFRTNLEAAASVARQLRLRNLGGMIIVDFIDMLDEEHKRQVIRTLEKALSRDQVRTQISEVSSLGLVEITRKRTRESLERQMCQPCDECNGRGFIKTPETICYEIFREISRSANAYEVKKFMILASQEIIDCLLDEEANSLAELEVEIDTPIRLQTENLYSADQFDVVLV